MSFCNDLGSIHEHVKCDDNFTEAQIELLIEKMTILKNIADGKSEDKLSDLKKYKK